VLAGVVPADDPVDLAGGDDRDRVRPDDEAGAGVVVRVGVGDEHARQRQAGALDLVPDPPGVRHGELAVDHHHAVGAVDEERVDRHDPAGDALDRDVVCLHGGTIRPPPAPGPTPVRGRLTRLRC
jgi:hypothetical protein